MKDGAGGAAGAARYDYYCWGSLTRHRDAQIQPHHPHRCPSRIRRRCVVAMTTPTRTMATLHRGR